MISKKYVVSFTLALVLGCVVVTHARHHGPVPGVDEPYDPGNYYSPTSISVPDSAPSAFTLRDIASQGGLVYDPERHAKSIQESIKTALETNNQYQALVNEIKNITTTISMTGFNSVKEITNKITQTASSMPDISTETLDSTFRNVDSAVDPRRSFDDKEKYRYLEKIYKNAATAANENNVNESNEALNNAMTDSINSEGVVDARKSKAEINSIMAGEKLRRNFLQSQLNVVETVKSMNDADKENKAINDNKQLQIFFADPYHPDTYAQQFERPKGKGFVDF